MNLKFSSLTICATKQEIIFLWRLEETPPLRGSKDRHRKLDGGLPGKYERAFSPQRDLSSRLCAPGGWEGSGGRCWLVVVEERTGGRHQERRGQTWKTQHWCLSDASVVSSVQAEWEVIWWTQSLVWAVFQDWELTGSGPLPPASWCWLGFSLAGRGSSGHWSSDKTTCRRSSTSSAHQGMDWLNTHIQHKTSWLTVAAWYTHTHTQTYDLHWS